MSTIDKIIDEAWRRQDTGVYYEDLDNRVEYMTRDQWEDAARWAIAEALGAYEDAMVGTEESLEDLADDVQKTLWL